MVSGGRKPAWILALMGRGIVFTVTSTVEKRALLLLAMNFVPDAVPDGGVNDALNLDAHGKALSVLLLDLHIDVPA